MAKAEIEITLDTEKMKEFIEDVMAAATIERASIDSTIEALELRVKALEKMFSALVSRNGLY